MFLNLNHKKLEVYKVSRVLVKDCYKATLLLPAEEKFNMVQQIRRAALSVKLNIAEGASRKSEVERKRFYEISRSSLSEIDAGFETAIDMLYLKEEDLTQVGKNMNSCFALLSAMINN